MPSDTKRSSAQAVVAGSQNLFLSGPKLHGVKAYRGFMIIQMQLKLYLNHNLYLGYRLRCNAGSRSGNPAIVRVI